MSRSYSYYYALEVQRKRELYLNRITATTRQFYNRYMAQYQEMVDNDFAAYIPDEMNRLQNDLSQISGLLSTNPEAARELSYNVGFYISNMRSLASEARQQFERAERLRLERLREEKERQQKELDREYYDILRTLSNPIVINYSIADMEMLKKELDAGKIQSKAELRQRSEAVIHKAEQKAAEWKEKTVQNNKKKDIADVIDVAEERLKNARMENQEKSEELLSNIRALRTELNAGDNNSAAIENIKKKIVELDTKLDDALISEDTRRETVKAIIRQLREQEFVVESPEITINKEENFVKITAKKPSGKRAECRLDIHGRLKYKFDKYEGMTCLKDIEKFNVDLEKIYSIKLSDERVLWQNPDRLSRDAEQRPTNDGRKA